MKTNRRTPAQPSRVTLKVLAQRVGFSPATVSAVLNNSSTSSFPQSTKDRIWAAAQEFNYRPHFFARSLRGKRTLTIGVIAQVRDGQSALVVRGIEQYLEKRGFFFFVASHQHDEKVLEYYSKLLPDWGVEGIVAVDAPITKPFLLPTVAIGGNQLVKDVTNLVLDQAGAALLIARHLLELGHTEIAVLEGCAGSSDAKDRASALRTVFGQVGIELPPELRIQMDGDYGVPEAGYASTKRLLERTRRFTALIAYNDYAAMGAIRAIQESGLRVPEDISVIGFDDIPAATYCSPALTTVRQPFLQMGEIAARTLLEQIEHPARSRSDILFAPELVVRNSTARARSSLLSHVSVVNPGEPPALSTPA